MRGLSQLLLTAALLGAGICTGQWLSKQGRMHNRPSETSLNNTRTHRHDTQSAIRAEISDLLTSELTQSSSPEQLAQLLEKALLHFDCTSPSEVRKIQGLVMHLANTAPSQLLEVAAATGFPETIDAALAVATAHIARSSDVESLERLLKTVDSTRARRVALQTILDASLERNPKNANITLDWLTRAPGDATVTAAYLAKQGLWDKLLSAFDAAHGSGAVDGRTLAAAFFAVPMKVDDTGARETIELTPEARAAIAGSLTPKLLGEFDMAARDLVLAASQVLPAGKSSTAFLTNLLHMERGNIASLLDVPSLIADPRQAASVAQEIGRFLPVADPKVALSELDNPQSPYYSVSARMQIAEAAVRNAITADGEFPVNEVYALSDPKLRDHALQVGVSSLMAQNPMALFDLVQKLPDDSGKLLALETARAAASGIGMRGMMAPLATTSGSNIEIMQRVGKLDPQTRKIVETFLRDNGVTP